MIERIGLLDERFFAYGEDVEWCYRGKLAGFKALFVSEPVVWHPDTRQRDAELGTGDVLHLATIFCSYANIVLVSAAWLGHCCVTRSGLPTGPSIPSGAGLGLSKMLSGWRCEISPWDVLARAGICELDQPFVSVIIPTYNRTNSLLLVLDSVARQTYPTDRFEVIVVDDGGSDGTEAVAQRTFPFLLRYVRQAKQGATVARNHGAEHSQGEYLVFMDDDIVLRVATLRILADELTLHHQTVILGTLHLPFQLSAKSPFASMEAQGIPGQYAEGIVPFKHA